MSSVTTEHNVAMIKGDLNGITVSDAVLKVDAAAKPLMERPISYTFLDYNADYFLKKGITELGKEELDVLAAFDQIFLGAVGDPTKIKPGLLEKGILLKVRQAFDQYVNLRPIILPEGVPSVIVGKTYKDINFEICRENSEGLYCNIGWVEKPGTPDEAGYQIMKCTYKGVKRLAEFAVQRAIARQKGGKPTIHFVFKSNVLTEAAVPWDRVYEEYAKRTDIRAVSMYIDAFAMQMIAAPEQFDVVLTENMFGDIVTDLGAMLQGGIGTAISGNLNPTSILLPSMFEPVHGTAPNLWYKMDDNGKYIPGTFLPEMVQMVRPEAALMSYAMMLEHMGEGKAARAVNEAALANMRRPDYKTAKLDELVGNACDSVRRAA